MASTTPLRVIGVYSPGANEAEYAECVKREVASLADHVTPERLVEWREYFEQSLSRAALIEVLVDDPDPRFSIGDFTQPDPGQTADRWQVAWLERFLSSDGERLIGDEYSGLPKERTYRAVFYIHYWIAGQPLLSSYGPLELPQMSPMPSRLWRLARYREVD